MGLEGFRQFTIIRGISVKPDTLSVGFPGSYPHSYLLLIEAVATIRYCLFL